VEAGELLDAIKKEKELRKNAPEAGRGTGVRRGNQGEFKSLIDRRHTGPEKKKENCLEAKSIVPNREKVPTGAREMMKGKASSRNKNSHWGVGGGVWLFLGGGMGGLGGLGVCLGGGVGGGCWGGGGGSGGVF